jgi:hypothetical protein
MYKTFRKLFWPLKPKDVVKTRPLELIHSNIIMPTSTPTMQGYQYIIMFTNNYSRYAKVYLRMKAKSGAPARFQEYVAIV